MAVEVLPTAVGPAMVMKKLLFFVSLLFTYLFDYLAVLLSLPAAKVKIKGVDNVV